MIVDAVSLDDFVNIIQENLRILRMDVRKLRNDHNGKLYYVLVNQQGDDVAKQNSPVTSADAEFFKLTVRRTLRTNASIRRVRVRASMCTEARS
jgi:hypothetical protein